jgi:hypothetical protein
MCAIIRITDGTDIATPAQLVAYYGADYKPFLFDDGSIEEHNCMCPIDLDNYLKHVGAEILDYDGDYDVKPRQGLQRKSCACPKPNKFKI